METRQVATANLLEDLDEILLELRGRLDERLRRSGEDLVVADEAYLLSGLIEASTTAAAEHAQLVRLKIEALYPSTKKTCG